MSRRTPLYNEHARLGAKFTEFGGWEMPVQYSGVTDEHNAVRTQVGIFDVSHMGEILVTGRGALPFLQRVTTNDVTKLKPGRAQYSLLLHENGGVVDDIIVYQIGTEEFLICVNADNTEKDFRWLCEQSGETSVENYSSQYGQIAVQGPEAAAVLTDFLGLSSDQLAIENYPLFSIFRISPSGLKSCFVARTGYTGEDGFEIYCDVDDTVALWRGLLECGAPMGIKPAGLAARDTLRLEACLPLYGHELRDDFTPLASRLGWVVKFDKGEFIGREALLREREKGPRYLLVGLEVQDKGIIRHQNSVFDRDNNAIGWVTSGTKTPSLPLPVGLALVLRTHAEIGTELWVDVRGRKLLARVVKTPFYKRSR